MAAESGNPWSARGTVVGAIDRDSGKTISGKLIDIIGDQV
jgi:hypothetical protein